MTANKKILTVSYGTFSCTLEGFDDSFGTMKAIAEYFRDLASDDRYFGAEPPQPDVEMLARIAEREISRRVGARERDGAYILSASAASAGPQSPHPPRSDGAEQEPPAQAVAQPEGDPRLETQANADPASHEAPKPGNAEGPAPATAGDATSSAEKVSEPEPNASHKTPPHMKQPAPSPEALDSKDSETHSETVDAEIVEDSAAFFVQPSAHPVSAKDDPTGANPGVDAPADNSIAAKLQRIRAVVLKSKDAVETDAMLDEEYTEDLLLGKSDRNPGASDAPAPSAAADFDISERPDAAIGEHALAKSEAEDIGRSMPTDEAEVANILAQIEAEASPASEATDKRGEDLNEADNAVLVLEEPIQDEIEASDLSDTNADILENVAETLAREKSGDAAAAAPGTLDGDDRSTSEERACEAKPDQALVKSQAPRARIIKVKRSEIDAAIASGALEEIEDTDANGDAEQDAGGNALEVTADETNDKGPVQTTRRTIGEPSSRSTVKDDDVSRLMAEADTQLQEPEGSRRRSAFAHLKAAVMAKKDEGPFDKHENSQDEAFRSDLASVVKPRRPEAREASSGAESKRPAPLKLVAEQRVDASVTPAGPVRPRRVATRIEQNDVETATSFEEYADEMGAHDLPALLEAAASYLSFVEGREQFSRPQLMTKVRQIEKDQFSREDGLRHFGQLLRAGKIEKIKGGRFAVTGDIGFQPDQRAAG